MRPSFQVNMCAPGFGHQSAFRAAAVAQRDGKVLFDPHKTDLFVVHAAVAQPVAVGTQVLAYGVFAGQLGAKRQSAFGVCVVKTFAAVGAIPVKIRIDGLQTMGAGNLMGHSTISSLVEGAGGKERAAARGMQKKAAALRWTENI